MENAERIKTQVLVLGGGFAGTWAAIRAAELGAEVILVDKAFVSRSGASTLTSGVTNGPTRDDDLKVWAEELIRRGQYMCDQRWTLQLLHGQVERLEQLRNWGAPIMTDESGRFLQYLSRGMETVRCVHYAPKGTMEVLRRKSLELGVRIIDRMSVVDLLTSDDKHPTSGRVCGAVAFDTRTGQTLVIEASRTILATGPLTVRGFRPIDNDTGDGLVMALRAGALVVDLEFMMSGTFNTVSDMALSKQFRVISLFNLGLGHGLKLVNRDGERFMQRYDAARMERSELPLVVAAFARELEEGRGPVFMDLTECDPEFWEHLRSARGDANAKILFSGELPDPRTTPIVIEAPRTFNSSGRGGPQIDLECRTTTPGLLAAGAVAKNNATGTHGSAGVPTAFAMVTGYIAGEIAAREALSARDVTAPQSAQQVTEWDRIVHAPLARSTGISTQEALDHVLALQGTVIDNLHLDEDTLSARLRSHNSLSTAFANICAADVHELVRAHELASTFTWMGYTFQAMLRRNESRTAFVRIDYPYTDDFAWRCLHGVQVTTTGTEFTKIPFPDETAMFPPPLPQRYMDDVAKVILETQPGRSYDESRVA